jgi:hypothetical protein
VAVLRERNFRLLFLGQAASTLGDGIVFVALALYVTDIGSPSDVGLVLAAATRRLPADRRRVGRQPAAPPRDDRDRSCASGCTPCWRR